MAFTEIECGKARIELLSGYPGLYFPPASSLGMSPCSSFCPCCSLPRDSGNRKETAGKLERVGILLAQTGRSHARLHLVILILARIPPLNQVSQSVWGWSFRILDSQQSLQHHPTQHGQVWSPLVKLKRSNIFVRCSHVGVWCLFIHARPLWETNRLHPSWSAEGKQSASKIQQAFSNLCGSCTGWVAEDRKRLLSCRLDDLNDPGLLQTRQNRTVQQKLSTPKVIRGAIELRGKHSTWLPTLIRGCLQIQIYPNTAFLPLPCWRTIWRLRSQHHVIWTQLSTTHINQTNHWAQRQSLQPPQREAPSARYPCSLRSNAPIQASSNSLGQKNSSLPVGSGNIFGLHLRQIFSKVACVPFTEVLKKKKKNSCCHPDSELHTD